MCIPLNHVSFRRECFAFNCNTGKKQIWGSSLASGRNTCDVNGTNTRTSGKNSYFSQLDATSNVRGTVQSIAGLRENLRPKLSSARHPFYENKRNHELCPTRFTTPRVNRPYSFEHFADSLST